MNNNNLQNNTWAGLVLDGTTNTTIYQNKFNNNPLEALAQNGTETASTNIPRVTTGTTGQAPNNVQYRVVKDYSTNTLV